MDTSLLTSARKHIEVRRGHALVLWPWTFRTEENDGNTIGDQSQRTVSSKSFSVPPPQARWTMNNAPVIISRSVYISLISQALILLNVDNDVHSQIFRASLSNGYRSSDENTAAYSQIHIIQVTEPQPSRSTHSLEIILAPKDVKLLILEGQESKATFECIFNARPANALRVQWFRRIFSTKHSEIRLLDTRDNHSSCDQGVRRHKFDKSGLNRSITISKVVQASSDFQEEYICKALLETTNEDQFAASKDRFSTGLSTGGMPFKESMSATARLWIISPPRLGFPRQMIPMEVWIKNGRPRAANIQGVVSSKQVLTCMYEYTGQPKATMSWLKNAQVLKNDGSRCVPA
ncbi:unnamed protein product [Dicrocoelium dendriticum]|nr:unnamed protein product [Dicrocoelium dendriticum]